MATLHEGNEAWIDASRLGGRSECWELGRCLGRAHVGAAIVTDRDVPEVLQLESSRLWVPVLLLRQFGDLHQQIGMLCEHSLLNVMLELLGDHKIVVSVFESRYDPFGSVLLVILALAAS